MNQASNYIIENNLSEFYFSIAIFGLTGVALLATYFKKYLTLPKGQKPKPTNLIWAIVAFLVPVYIYYFDYKKWEALRDNAKETTGTTIEKICGRKQACSIKYEYEINGQTYQSSCGYTYFGKSIKGIKIKGGQYIVIYNGANPQNSVMDFKRPLSNKR